MHDIDRRTVFVADVLRLGRLDGALPVAAT
jgi:hypothetical protein